MNTFFFMAFFFLTFSLGASRELKLPIASLKYNNKERVKTKSQSIQISTTFSLVATTTIYAINMSLSEFTVTNASEYGLIKMGLDTKKNEVYLDTKNVTTKEVILICIIVFLFLVILFFLYLFLKQKLIKIRRAKSSWILKVSHIKI